MEAMDIDVNTQEVVDLSISARRRTTMPTTPFPARTGIIWPHRRSLRPRTEHRSYAESPDIVIVSDEEPRTNGLINGNYESDDEDFEFPQQLPIKELSEQELSERAKKMKKLRDDLRNEEMTLVLLKKLRQSTQLKENIAVVAPCQTQNPPQTPVHVKPITPRSSNKMPTLQQPGGVTIRYSSHSMVSSMQDSGYSDIKKQTIMSRTLHPTPMVNPMSANRSIPPGLPVSLHQTNISISRGNNNINVRSIGISFPSDRKDSRHSPVPIALQQERRRNEESLSPAQRNAAAKDALRTSLEKALLQIVHPKPPAPEMHFIPNPSNTEFIYLVGLEHVVDFITKDSRSPPPPEPFRCAQCSTNFTPVWKWEKGSSKGKEPKVICEQCVTDNVKMKLKDEHSRMLKTAFVKALHQEHEIDRMTQSSPQPEPPPTPQPPPIVKPSTPKPAPPIPSPNRDHLAKLADSAKFSPHHVAATLHQQLLRGLPQHQPLPAHMLPFSPLLYPYQLAMAQAAGGKNPVAAAAANIVELQRQAADLQRQYLLDMIPAPPSASRHSINWKS